VAAATPSRPPNVVPRRESPAAEPTEQAPRPHPRQRAGPYRQGNDAALTARTWITVELLPRYAPELPSTRLSPTSTATSRHSCDNLRKSRPLLGGDELRAMCGSLKLWRPTQRPAALGQLKLGPRTANPSSTVRWSERHVASSTKMPKYGMSLRGGAYSAALAFLMASSPSSKVMSGVVCTDFTAPPAEIAIDRAAALT
jgi:hypothetical protein